MPDLEVIRLTERDKAIIAAVSRYRFLTTSLILSLVPGSRQNITRRLQRLYHAGLVDRPRAQFALRYTGDLSEIVYSAIDSGRGRKPTTSLFLAHALLVSEVLIRIESDCRDQGVLFIAENEILAASKQEPTMRHMRWRVAVKSAKSKEQIGIIPDASFAIEMPNSGQIHRRYFFLEADRGTMPLYRRSLRLSSIRRKALAYARSRRRCVLKERFGIPGFQVLFITQSDVRAEAIKKLHLQVNENQWPNLFLCISLSELRQQGLMQILVDARQ